MVLIRGVVGLGLGAVGLGGFEALVGYAGLECRFCCGALGGGRRRFWGLFGGFVVAWFVEAGSGNGVVGCGFEMGVLSEVLKF